MSKPARASSRVMVRPTRLAAPVMRATFEDDVMVGSITRASVRSRKRRRRRAGGTIMPRDERYFGATERVWRWDAQAAGVAGTGDGGGCGWRLAKESEVSRRAES